MTLDELIEEFVWQTSPSTRPKVYSERDLIIEREQVLWKKGCQPIGMAYSGQYLLVKDYVRFFVADRCIPADDGEFQYLEPTPGAEKAFRIWQCEHISDQMARDLKLASILPI